MTNVSVRKHSHHPEFCYMTEMDAFAAESLALAAIIGKSELRSS